MVRYAFLHRAETDGVSFRRVVHGACLLYLLALVFILSQTEHNARQFLTFFYPDLGKPPAANDLIYAAGRFDLVYRSSAAALITAVMQIAVSTRRSRKINLLMLPRLGMISSLVLPDHDALHQL